MEVVERRRALQLTDPSFSGTWSANELLRCIHIGLLCVQDQAKDRPDMLDVVSFLSNETILLAKPKQPAFFINALENEATSPANAVENYQITWKRHQDGFYALTTWLNFSQIFLNLDNSTAMLHGRNLPDDDPHPDFISIDCGSSNDYLDMETGIRFSFFRRTDELAEKPEGRRNCYNLKPKQGKNNTYLIRAHFMYGNYDDKNKTPISTCTSESTFGTLLTTTHLLTSLRLSIHVCLIKSFDGIPYLSALELRPLSNSIYQMPSPSLSILYKQGAFDFSLTSNLYSDTRYKDDIYDRLWRKINVSAWYPSISSAEIHPQSINNSYKLPADVFQILCLLSLCEIEQLRPGQKRTIDITLDDENILARPITLEYLKPQTIIAPHRKATQGYVRFNISATSESDAPPILNAFEVFKLISPLPSPTDKRDVDAILDIKNGYKITKLDWQGDPCVPKLAWEGLGCSSGIDDNHARITSVDVTGNKLTGSVPKALKRKVKWKFAIKHKFVIQLAASVSALVVILLVSLGVWIFKTKKLKGQKRLEQKKLLHEIGDIAIPLSVSEKWKFSKSDKTGHEIHIFNFKSIVLASDNVSSTNKLGEGGFGPVYKGRLLDGREIAIKRLSKCSKQGLTEFKNEVKLNAKLQDTNLVRLPWLLY
ncbi:probable LRR receptor-like serine/threonine-protein kinase MEE39 [Prosopis cineraria]|uniref:probable LRR receptor-like serine/threonine-protein kinase MEE39 n=1 Tax=Prosopis cineraria TaxID=364024 RepID=UPI00240EA89B|nr:probable LRR receptor-like serine/threonine-protein kinase MEE39 [Prosopis cineraria]